MGGEIAATSALGRGSAFTFTVTVIADRSAPPVDAGAAARRSIAHGASAETPRSILIAEDNETSRYLIATMMRRLGHNVDAVTNGADAVMAVEAKAYDVVLMDMQMPVVDGPEAMRIIRKLTSSAAQVRIIALTADIITSHRAEYFSAGVNAIVGKPVDWTELSAEIERQAVLRSEVGSMRSPVIADPLPEDGAYPERSKNGGTEDAVQEWHQIPVLDDEALSSLSEALGKNILTPLLLSFANNMHAYLEDLTEAVRVGDFLRAKRTAHTLKGLSMQFGADRVGALAKFIEGEATGIAEVGVILPRLADTVVAT